MKHGKRLTVFLTAVMLSMGLTGCGENQIPDLTDEQIQAVGEYVAITLMKYDLNHQSRLMELKTKDIPEIVPPIPETEEPSGMGPVDDTPVVNSPGAGMAGSTTGSMRDAMGLAEGVDVAFLEHTVCDSYPNDSDSMSVGFSLDASKGKKLLVLHFSLTNTTEQEQEVDLFSSNVVYSITVNEEYTRRALTSLMPDDMGTYQGTLAAGDSSRVVLIIEIEDEMAESITSVSLRVKNEDKIYGTQLIQ